MGGGATKSKLCFGGHFFVVAVWLPKRSAVVGCWEHVVALACTRPSTCTPSVSHAAVLPDRAAACIARTPTLSFITLVLQRLQHQQPLVLLAGDKAPGRFFPAPRQMACARRLRVCSPTPWRDLLPS
eukprot:365322-Chlamydomonas_euryale.AAC.12